MNKASSFCFIIFIYFITRNTQTHWDQQQPISRFPESNIPYYSYSNSPSWRFPNGIQYEGQRGFKIARSRVTLQQQQPGKYQTASCGNSEIQQRQYNEQFHPYESKMRNSNISQQHDKYPPH